MLTEGLEITGNALYLRAGRGTHKETAIKWLATRQRQRDAIHTHTAQTDMINNASQKEVPDGTLS